MCYLHAATLSCAGAEVLRFTSPLTSQIFSASLPELQSSQTEKCVSAVSSALGHFTHGQAQAFEFNV